jgi:hypothetical protein
MKIRSDRVMHRYAADTTTDTTLVTTAETVVATLAGVSLPRAGHSVDLEGHVTLATGTATTGLTLRVRRDGLTGALVGETTPDAVEAAAGSVETHDITATDAAPGELANATYVLTAQQVAATGNGNVTHASLEASIR